MNMFSFRIFRIGMAIVFAAGMLSNPITSVAAENPQDISDGLVAYYKFDGNANDASGYENHGTVYGASPSQDRFGQANSAYYFDGVDDYIDIGNDASLKMTDGLTIATWLRVDSLSPWYQNVISDHAPNEPTVGSGKILRFTYNRLQFHVGGIYGYGTAIYVEYPYTNDMVGQWQHVVGTYDRSMVKFYLNGVLVASRAYTEPLAVNPNPLLIGKSGFEDHLQGAVDELRIYNRAITEAEVQQLFCETPSNTAPVITVSQPAITVDEGQTATNNGTISDAENDPVSLSASVGEVVNNNDGTWSWSFATSNVSESQTVIITADDGNGGTSQASFALTVNNVEIPNPYIHVRANADSVEAMNWPMGAELILTIDDPATTNDYISPEPVTVTQTAPWSPDETYVFFDLNEVFDIQPGFVVSVSNGMSTKTHKVTNLSFINVGLDTDIVSGIASLGAYVQIWVCEGSDCNYQQNTTADAITGEWEVDFTGIYDIAYGTWIDSSENDANGNSTMYGIVTSPYIHVRANADSVEAMNWPMGAELTLTIDDPATTNDYISPEPVTVTQTAPWSSDETYVFFDLKEIFDIQPGFVVSVSDGMTTKTHTVTNLAFTDIDLDNDTVTGIAGPNAHVDIWICDNSGCPANRHTDADGDGNWMADFGNPGVQPDEQTTYDIVPGTWIDSSQNDDDSDQTMFGINTPNPTFIARLGDNRVEANDWPVTTLLTLTIDDPATTNSPDYTDTSTAELWDPSDPASGTTTTFELGNSYVLKSGDEVAVSGAGITKTTIVADIHITSVDVENDIVYGTAGPGISTVSVRAPKSPVEMQRNVGVVDGLWVADFSVPTPEYGTYDITYTPGNRIVARWWDEDGDMTSDSWRVPNPIFWVWRDYHPGVETVGWPLDVEVTLTIDDPKTPQNSDYGPFTAITGMAPWPGSIQTYAHFPEVGGLNIQAGYIFSVTDGVITKTHIVTSLEITEVNPNTNIVTGTAAPYSEVELDAPDLPDAIAEATADGNGNWSAHFSDIYDIVPDTFIEAMQWDEDNDLTLDGLANRCYHVTASIVPNGGGSVNVPPDRCAGGYGLGWVAELIATAAPGYEFIGWSGDASGTENPLSVTMDADKNIIANFLRTNQPPVADAGGPYNVVWGATLTLDGSGSTDPDINIASYEWDLDNDGQYDDASGVTVTTSFNQSGAHTIGLRVIDEGGLSDTDTATVTVLPWTLRGFYPPVDMNGVYNIVKNGSTVPLKFEVFAGSIELTDVASIKSLTYAQTSCDVTAITDEIETTATGGTSLRYADGQFIYNWKTPKTAGKCYRVTMTTIDNSSLVAYFKLK